MEEKYDPIRILEQAWAHVCILEKSIQPHEIVVVIECQGKRPYVILKEGEGGPLRFGIYTGVALRYVQHKEALYKDRELLGKATIKYRGKEKTWSSFEDFWK